MIDHSNFLTRFLQISILAPDSLKQRADRIKWIVQMGEELERTHDYSSLGSVVRALNSNPIHLLKTVWKKVPSDVLDKFKQIFFGDSNFSRLRKLQDEASSPAIPYIGVSQKDLISLGEVAKGNRRNEQRKYDHFKAIRYTEQIRKLTVHQKTPFPYAEDTDLQSILGELYTQMGPSSSVDDYLYELSDQAKRSDLKENVDALNVMSFLTF